MISSKSRTGALLLCLFLGMSGVHRFYVGKWKTGILYILTCGLCGFGVVIDDIKIIMGLFTDKDGLPVLKW